jgi:hypothetical protein
MSNAGKGGGLGTNQYEVKDGKKSKTRSGRGTKPAATPQSEDDQPSPFMKALQEARVHDYSESAELFAPVKTGLEQMLGAHDYSEPVDIFAPVRAGIEQLRESVETSGLKDIGALMDDQEFLREHEEYKRKLLADELRYGNSR